MCDPVSLTLLVVGTAITATAQYQAGQVQAEAQRAAAAINSQSQEFNATLQRQAGDNERMVGQYEARRAQEKAQRLQALQTNQFASTGILIDDGTPMDVIIDSAREADMDVAAIEWRTNLKASNQYKSSEVSKYNAKAELVGGEIKAKASEKAGAIAALGTVGSALTSAPVLGGAKSFFSGLGSGIGGSVGAAAKSVTDTFVPQSMSTPGAW